MNFKKVTLVDLELEVSYEGSLPLILVDTVRAVDESGAAVGPDLFGVFYNSYFMVDDEGSAIRVMDAVMQLVMGDLQPEQLVLH